MNSTPIKKGRGLVLGKFLPPHRGHQFLIEFARQYSQHLTVIVGTLDREPIPGALRYQWVRQLFPTPDVHVVHVSDDLPQFPEEHPDFWAIWRAVIHRAAPEGVDFFFASEGYGTKTAEVIGGGCQYIAVDQARQLVPISGTLVRSNPMKYWDFLSPIVRTYFLKRVCIVGPESTGKSTLAANLACHFNTVHAWEYARPLLDAQGGQCFAKDIPLIVRGQIATEDALAPQANRVLICDTDVLTTMIWSDMLFGDTPEWVRKLADERTYDLYIVPDTDVRWVQDGQRFFGDEKVRRGMFERFIAELEKRGRRYVIVRGDWKQRFESACAPVGGLIEG
jgi:HTH-type transcriptional repressor of NAD biosynthesis genes